MNVSDCRGRRCELISGNRYVFARGAIRTRRSCDQCGRILPDVSPKAFVPREVTHAAPHPAGTLPAGFKDPAVRRRQTSRGAGFAASGNRTRIVVPRPGDLLSDIARKKGLEIARLSNRSRMMSCLRRRVVKLAASS
jgi:hypothetical protein